MPENHSVSPELQDALQFIANLGPEVATQMSRFGPDGELPEEHAGVVQELFGEIAETASAARDIVRRTMNATGWSKRLHQIEGHVTAIDACARLALVTFTVFDISRPDGATLNVGALLYAVGVLGDDLLEGMPRAA